MLNMLCLLLSTKNRQREFQSMLLRYMPTPVCRRKHSFFPPPSPETPPTQPAGLPDVVFRLRLAVAVLGFPLHPAAVWAVAGPCRRLNDKNTKLKSRTSALCEKLNHNFLRARLTEGESRLNASWSVTRQRKGEGSSKQSVHWWIN